MNLTDAARNEVDPRSLTGQDSATLEHLSRRRISAWWTRAGLTESYPAADGEIIRLCQAVEYAITGEEMVRFIGIGAFDGVSVSHGRRNWSATDIVRLATFLECRRQWQPGSEIHRAKKTAYETALETLRATGESHEFFTDLEHFDLRALMLMLVEADNRQQREALYVAVQIKLESFCITL
ncbi:MAG: hypothetical protein NT013_17595 [Planctomycetia bacterium]|nr:hypothetical protein [Planctomycetia bacterium]